jgi:hypothetical protein
MPITLINKQKLPGIKSKPYQVNIALIRGIGFYIGIKYKENEFFITSLYEINYIINKKSRNAKITNETEEEILRRIMPKKYYNLIQVFFKKESNKLSLYY